jgi:predicted  nucleic acid-binding Zn-ribbon protein
VLEVIAKFIELQQLEDEILANTRILEESPQRLAESMEGLEAARAERDVLASGLAETRSRIRELELDLLKLKELKEGNRVRITKATDDKSYKAILKEGDVIKQRTSEKEDESLNLMGELERIQEALPAAEGRFQENEAAHRAIKAAVTAAVRRAEEAVASARRHITDILASIASDHPAAAEQYAASSKIHHGKVLAPVSKGTCMACRLRIPPQLFNDLQASQKILLCPSCARIMYWADHPSWASPAPPAEAPPEEPAPKRKKPRRSAGA